MAISSTKIESNIVNYLFVDLQCPHCQETVFVSLGSLYRKEPLQCSKCGGAVAAIFLKGGRLERFAQAFDNLYEQLQTIGHTLLFAHELPPKI